MYESGEMSEYVEIATWGQRPIAHVTFMTRAESPSLPEHFPVATI